MHARMQRRHGDSRVSAGKARKVKVTRLTLVRLAQSLRALVQGLKLPAVSTNWGDYYADTNYTHDAFESKRGHVSTLLDRLAPATVLDLGANRGTFSHSPVGRTELVIAADMDPLAVERHYQDLTLNKAEGILPLVVDLSNPSPSLGWHNEERSSFLERCNVDVVLALALIHHLSIANNVPFEMSATAFCRARALPGVGVRAQGGLTSAAHAGHQEGYLRRLYARDAAGRLRSVFHAAWSGGKSRVQRAPCCCLPERSRIPMRRNAAPRPLVQQAIVVLRICR